MNLDERIDDMAGWLPLDAEELTKLEDDIKQLIRDVLEYVKPEEVVVRDPDDKAEAYVNGYGKACYRTEAKIKELGL